MANKILIVDDEPLIVKGLKFSLEQDGYETDVAYDGEEAIAKWERGDFSLILLDLMLPTIDGLEVCQKIREKSQIPIIMLTAKGDDMDKILGLEYGADDYITKPFNILEVKTRIRTILRRVAKSNQANEPRVWKVGDMVIDTDKRTVKIAGREAGLTAKEYEILLLFVANPGKVFNREVILDTIWRNDSMCDLRTVDVHIRRLREKVETDPGNPEYIFTKWGVGYYFADK
jgi:DNA-binding response OmpR family regulator